MTTIQAIETHYNGFRFRSRREARWAVFMDSLQVPYQYEPQGYVLDGEPYLPDFLVHPDTERAFWLEIKGTFPTAEERAKASRLAVGTEMDVFLYFGPIEVPPPELSSITTWDGFHRSDFFRLDWHDKHGWIPNESEAARWQIGLRPTAFRFDKVRTKARSGFYWWTDCPECDFVGLKYAGQVGWCPSFGEFGTETAKALEPEQSRPRFAHATPRLIEAYRAARSARFEHGESG